MHPEIAPNEYNKLLSKHGVDETGTGSNLLARRSLSRRKSGLSAQYNPEDDDDDEVTPEKVLRRKSVAVDTMKQDFLSGAFSAPLEEMGVPPLKTKTSLRRATSQPRPLPTRKSSFPSLHGGRPCVFVSALNGFPNKQTNKLS